jgi:N-acetylmuramoyl-L-alanine amidase
MVFMKCKIGVMLSVCCLLFFLEAPVYATPGLVTDVQYWLAPDHIQTIISFSHSVDYSYHHRSNPPRFVLEIPLCENLWGDQKIPVNDVILQQIRVQRLSSGTLQVVFDLVEKVEAAVQTFPKVNGQPDRVVVTLFDQTREESSIQVQQPVQTQPQRLVQPQLPVRSPSQQQYLVVLDPGHGGRDPGASGPSGLKEKDVVLDLAKKMQTIIQQKAPNITVVLTRDGDTFLSLRKRTELAEERHADLFVSLHVNANPNKKVHGFSVYTLSENATDAAARELAEKENAVDLLFGGIETPVPGNDSLLTFVLADLTKTAGLQHSLEFGQIAVDTTVSALRQHSISREGLKRANFAVLRTAAMPAVLVEACYMSNKKEEALLKRKDFRMQIAQALAESTVQYFAQRQSAHSKPQLAQAREVFPSLSHLQSGQDYQNTYRSHVVKSGESLSVIAGRYDVELAQLRQVNKLASADLIYVGQRLWIP